MSDMINHPTHYTKEGIEPIDYIESHNFNFNLGNAVKYITRAGEKVLFGETKLDATIRDLQKAEWYCRREWQRLEKSRHLADESVSELPKPGHEHVSNAPCTEKFFVQGDCTAHAGL